MFTRTVQVTSSRGVVIGGLRSIPTAATIISPCCMAPITTPFNHNIRSWPLTIDSCARRTITSSVTPRRSSDATATATSDEWEAARRKPFGIGDSIMVPSSSSTVANRGRSRARSHLLTHTSEDVYQCDCIGWRQSKASDLSKRTCKHLKLLLGVAAEHTRVGLPPPTVEELKSDEQKAEEKEAKRAARESKASAKLAEKEAKAAARAAKQAEKEEKKSQSSGGSSKSSRTKSVATKSVTKRQTVDVADGVADAVIVEPSSTTATKTAKTTKTKATKSATTSVTRSTSIPSSNGKSNGNGDVNKNDLLADTKQPEPPMLLAEKYTDDVDPTGWWLSEKLDGVRAWWSGTTRMLITRSGQLLRPPSWFIDQLPDEPLDGELWMGRGKFSQTAGALNRVEEIDEWKTIKFVVFDAPNVAAPFEHRVQRMRTLLEKCTYAVPVEQQQCTGRDHLTREVDRVIGAGGEGIMLRAAGSMYVDGRSSTLLKAKKYYDDEGIIVAHEEGGGRNAGRMGAIMIRLKSGRQVRLGSGFTDDLRNHPPAVGTVVTFRYSDITVTGLPRFAVFIRTRDDMTAADFEHQAAAHVAANPQSSTPSSASSATTKRASRKKTAV